ncbi:hypothetical protein V8E51_006097 [Hyaloscypha variabilis]
MESDDESDTRSTRTLSTSSGGSDVEDLGTYSEDENSRRRRSSTLPASRRFSTATTANNSDNDDDDSYVLLCYGCKPRRLSVETGGFDEDFEDLTDDELNEAGYTPALASVPRPSPQIRRRNRNREDIPQDPIPWPNPNSILAWREAHKLSRNNGHVSQQAKLYRDDMHSSQYTSASSPFPPDPRNSQSLMAWTEKPTTRTLEIRVHARPAALQIFIQINYSLQHVILATTRKGSVHTLICASTDFTGFRARDNPQLTRGNCHIWTSTNEKL